MRSLIAAIFCGLPVLILSADAARAIDAQWSQGSALPYIVQADTTLAARREIERVGGTPGKELEMINAVAANLTTSQLVRLSAHGNARAYPKRSVGAE